MTDRLSVTGVSKTFGSQRVLKDLELGIGAGEVHAIVGHNGSGKSTLVKILAGFHQPDPGARATVDGAAFELGSASAAEAAGLRFVHQDLGLVQTMDTVDNLHLEIPYPLRLGRRIDWPAAKRRATDSLAALGFDFDVSVPVGDLTPTQQTGVAIARAIQGGRHESRVIVLDEPTAALPAPDVEMLFGVIRNLQSRGLGILYISHHLEEVFALADRITVLRDGARVTTKATQDLDEERLVALVVGQALAVSGRSARPSSQAQPILAVRQLTGKSLNGVSLVLRPGEVVGVTGVDGSGREELAAAIFGGVHRNGEVEVGGQLLPDLRPDVAVERGVGLVPAERARDATLARLSMADNLTIASVKTAARGLRLDRAGTCAETQHWAQRLKISPYRPEAPIETLSGGNQQKVILARWLRTSPKVLLLDEPTKGVDVAAVAAIWGLVDDAARAGTAILACSSDTDELAANCDRVLVLRRGTVAAEVKRQDLDATRLDALAIFDGKDADA